MFDNIGSTIVPALCGTLIVFSVVKIISSIFLLTTAFENDNPKRLLPWLIITALSTFFLMGCLIYFAVYFSYDAVNVITCSVGAVFAGGGLFKFLLFLLVTYLLFSSLLILMNLYRFSFLLLVGGE